jgi:hypothetical protein
VFIDGLSVYEEPSIVVDDTQLTGKRDDRVMVFDRQPGTQRAVGYRPVQVA